MLTWCTLRYLSSPFEPCGTVSLYKDDTNVCALVKHVCLCVLATANTVPNSSRGIFVRLNCAVCCARTYYMQTEQLAGSVAVVAAATDNVCKNR